MRRAGPESSRHRGDDSIPSCCYQKLESRDGPVGHAPDQAGAVQHWRAGDGPSLAHHDRRPTGLSSSVAGSPRTRPHSTLVVTRHPLLNLSQSPTSPPACFEPLIFICTPHILHTHTRDSSHRQDTACSHGPCRVICSGEGRRIDTLVAGQRGRLDQLVKHTHKDQRCVASQDGVVRP